MRGDKGKGDGERRAKLSRCQSAVLVPPESAFLDRLAPEIMLFLAAVRPNGHKYRMHHAEADQIDGSNLVIVGKHDDRFAARQSNHESLANDKRRR